MTKMRYWGAIGLSLVLGVQTARTQCCSGSTATWWHKTPTTPASTKADSSYAVYSLEALGADAALGKWVADTIPQLIEPGSWQLTKGDGRPGVLSYFAPKNILVVSHSPAVQAKVEGFLKNLTAAAGTKPQPVAAPMPPKALGVVPAAYLPPTVIHAATPPPAGSHSAAPASKPKHLFHFIIRYEGDGIIDGNVIEFMKTQKALEEPARSEGSKDDGNNGEDGKEKAEKKGTPTASLSTLGALLGNALAKCCEVQTCVPASVMPSESFPYSITSGARGGLQPVELSSPATVTPMAR